jgi:endonuclease G
VNNTASLHKRLFILCAVVLTLLLGAFKAGANIDASLQMQLGNPSGAVSDTNNHDHYLIRRTVEAMDYSDNLGEPDWASWDLTASDIGTNARSTFITDMNLPPNFTRYPTSIYNNAGWDRGHLCPSKDRTDTSTNNDLVFLMSNVLPQNALNNSGVWLQFENYCRDLVQSTNNYELLLLCGGSGYSGARLTNGPFIPDFVWKIVVVVPPGAGFATNRITTKNRVIAVKIPNNDSATNT